jgi:hypothetical protein
MMSGLGNRGTWPRYGTDPLEKDMMSCYDSCPYWQDDAVAAVWTILVVAFSYKTITIHTKANTFHFGMT